MNPLKQGLKPLLFLGLIIIFHSVKVVNPLKQGLKRLISLMKFLISGIVKVVNPLKQGLKLFYIFSNDTKFNTLK